MNKEHIEDALEYIEDTLKEEEKYKVGITYFEDTIKRMQKDGVDSSTIENINKYAKQRLTAIPVIYRNILESIIQNLKVEDFEFCKKIVLQIKDYLEQQLKTEGE